VKLIILDTNVVSELMRPRPDARVIGSLRPLQPQLMLCAPVVYEVHFGIDRLQSAEPKARILDLWNNVFAQFGDARVLPIDAAAARYASEVKASKTGSRDHADIVDCLIAGIAIAQNAVVATRNARHFPIDRVEILDPWTASS
jgi:toxin FitB